VDDEKKGGGGLKFGGKRPGKGGGTKKPRLEAGGLGAMMEKVPNSTLRKCGDSGGAP